MEYVYFRFFSLLAISSIVICWNISKQVILNIISEFRCKLLLQNIVAYCVWFGPFWILLRIEISYKQCWNLYFKEIINQMSTFSRNCIAIHVLKHKMCRILCALVLLLKLLIFFRNSTKLSLYITHMIMQHSLNWDAIWFLLIKTKWGTWKIFQTALVDHLAGLVKMIIIIFRDQQPNDQLCIEIVLHNL